MNLRNINHLPVTIVWLLTVLRVHAQDTATAPAPGYLAPGTLAYHLSTNAAARTARFTGTYDEMKEYNSPAPTKTNDFTNGVWSKKFWLAGVRGLSATPVGFSNLLGGQGLPAMVSPRHYLCATHMHPEGYALAFLDTNNVIHWRTSLQRMDYTNDTSVGILNADLPPSVGFLPVLPANFAQYLPASNSCIVQGIGMNQDFRLYGQPMTFGEPVYVRWDSRKTVPFGVATNWNVGVRGGDSSSPEMLLINNQLVLVAHISGVGAGANCAYQIDALNRLMHQLSTNNHARSDYHLTQYSLTNWPKIQ